MRKKNNNKKIWIAVIAVIIVVLAALLIGSLVGGGSADTRTVTVEVVHSDGSSREFVLESEAENLGQAMVEGGVVVDNQGPYGLYILTADGETVNEADQEWWMLTKGGESVNTGADGVVFADGEHYELTFTVGYDF